MMKQCLYIIVFFLVALQLSAEDKSVKQNRKSHKSAESAGKTMAYTLPWDDMPIDLSFIYKDEKPAGKHGFLKVHGGRFVFEDGTEARFWGTTFNGATCFPSHDYSEKVTRRLSKTGINIVRLTILDGYNHSHNIFSYSKGRNRNSQSLDPESMDRLDYLIHCLKKAGIYIFMDCMTFRRFKSSDGVKEAEKLNSFGARPYSIFNRRMIELQKKYITDLWTHKNPYTKLAYKDEPAIALSLITNENDIWTFPRRNKRLIEPYRSELVVLYKEWAKKRNIQVKDKIDFNHKDSNINSFYIHLTRKYYTEMIRHMRDIGVKIPVSGTNWSKNSALLSAEQVTDYNCSNVYWDLSKKRYHNKSMTGSITNILTELAFNRVQDMPFVVTEWNQSYPNEWRAESPLLMASIGSFQGWGGIIEHSYTSNNLAIPDLHNYDGRIYHGSPVMNGNSTFNDPARFGLQYHAALIVRRGDVRQAEKTASIQIGDYYKTPKIPALKLTPERHRSEMILPGVKANGDVVVHSTDTVVDLKKGDVLSDTKELYRNFKKKIGWIDTPNTKAVYGFVGKERKISLTDLKITSKTDFATIAISSLTDEPIKKSTNMLLTAVGRADNTNSRYNKDHTRQLDPGHGPVQVEIIQAEIEIRTSVKTLRVLVIDTQGNAISYAPAKYKNGVFAFEIGKKPKPGSNPAIRDPISIFYLIEAW